MKFRFDINALRAIAVVGVILFHYKVPFFEGGFAGVDVFFVISGYLMSGIILNALYTNNFSIGRFYKKRIRRILPALLVLVFAFTIAGFFIYLPMEYKQYEKNASASILFLSNVLYWKESNYFDPSSDVNPFLHTWSLSVEWQFYLLFPIVLLFAFRALRSKARLFSAFLIGTALLFIFSTYFTKYYPTASFYLLPSRSWEMLLGGVAFLFPERLLKNPPLNKILAISGYVIAISCFIILNNKPDWPGLYTSLPAGSTFLVLISNAGNFNAVRISAIQFTGKISYSLYLWHWPIYVIASYYGFGTGFISIAGLVALTVVAAYFSYSFVESAEFSNRAIAGMSTMAIVAAVLSYVSVNNIMFKPETIRISNYFQDHKEERIKQFGIGCCFITSDNSGINDFDKNLCLKVDQDKKNILLIGDSHAAQFSASLREAFDTRNINLVQATASGCLPIIRRNGKNRCFELINYIYKDYIIKNATKIDGVIISANWIDDNRHMSETIGDIKATVDYLNALKIRTVIIGQNETYTMPFSTIAARQNENREMIQDKYLNDESAKINTLLSTTFNDCYINIYKIDSANHLSSNLVPYMGDQNHFTKYGADKIIEKIFQNRTFSNFLMISNK